MQSRNVSYHKCYSNTNYTNLTDITRKIIKKIIGRIQVNVAVQTDTADQGIFMCWPAQFILPDKLKEFQDEYESISPYPIKFVASYEPQVRTKVTVEDVDLADTSLWSM